VVCIAAGRHHSLAMNTKNDVYACGSGQYGQIGLPDKEMRTSFAHVLSLMSVNAYKVFAGGNHSWIILDDMQPKKDEFLGLNGAGKSKDSSMNSPRDNTS
jgi:alpha-tubulin suppressor-like RCC1 family protein